jgi:hypothetical protein
MCLQMVPFFNENRIAIFMFYARPQGGHGRLA